MSKLIDLSGKTFGRLTVIGISHKEQRGPRSTRVFWLCKCSCGNLTSVVAHLIRSGKTQSCGCFAHDRRVKAQTKHGENKPIRTKEYSAWSLMLQRCSGRTDHQTYKNYGSRGITVCDRWRSYENFLADMGRAPSPQHSLDRKDNNGNYEPSNCRWATRVEQMRNRRVTRLWSYKGQEKTLREWCNELKLNINLMTSRLYDGWTTDRAFEN